MRVCVFITLMVFQAVTCEKAISKLRRKLMVPKTNDKCKKIKCASVEDPHCVRMRRHDLGLTIHSIAANKCEFNYMKCHDDVEAKIVPMKFCGHIAGETSGNNKNKDKAHIRVKRRAKSANKSGLEHPGETTELKAYDMKSKLREMKKWRRIRKKLLLQSKSGKSDVITKYSVFNNPLPKRGSIRGQNAWPSHGIPFSTESDSNELEMNERKKLEKGMSGHRVSSMEERRYPLQYAKLENKAQELTESSEGKPKSSYFYGSKEYKPMQLPTIRVADSTDFPMISQESANYSKDKIENDALCPKVCPSRDVMVCGKCQHGVHKTFTSMCHLRMFACNHKEEEMSLVSRNPCVLSAPFLSDPGMKPQGRVVEPGDDDRVMRYIICRDQGKLGTAERPSDDPRCNFESMAKDKLNFYDYKGAKLPMDSHMLQNEEDNVY